jgi:hypothetical protein
VELDDDPQPEIALGVHKSTRYDPIIRRRLFIYDWTGSALAPKWLGSALALPLVDFSFFRPTGRRHHQLEALERSAHGSIKRLYRWNGFGFSGIAPAAGEQGQ